jgi:hypothetical protein
MPHLISFFIFFGFLLVCAAIFLFSQGRIRLSDEERSAAIKIIQSTKNLHPEHSIIKSHKAFIQALKSVKPEYQKLTAAQVTSKFEKNISNIKLIWRFHGLRNKAAHNPGFKIYKQTANNARKVYIQTLESL